MPFQLKYLQSARTEDSIFPAQLLLGLPGKDRRFAEQSRKNL